MGWIRQTIKTTATVLASLSGVAIAVKLFVWFLNAVGYMQTLEQIAGWIPWHKINESSWWIAPIVCVVCLIFFLLAQKWPAMGNGAADSVIESSLLKIECGPKIEGSQAQAWWTINGEPMPVNFFRIVVNATEESQLVKNCTGFLTRIEKDKKTKFGGNNAQLTFAPGEEPDALSKTIRYPVAEYLDVLVVTSRNQIFPGTKPGIGLRLWPFVPSMDEIFSWLGEYLITVVITGDGVIPPITAVLKFNWTGNWETAALTLIRESLEQADERDDGEVKRADRLVKTIGRRLTEIEKTIADDSDNVAVLEKLGIESGISKRLQNAPSTIECIEPQLIEEAYSVDRDLGWPVFREIGIAVKRLNEGIAKYNSFFSSAVGRELLEKIAGIRKLVARIEAEKTSHGESRQLKARRQKLKNLLAKRDRLDVMLESPGFDIAEARRRNETFIAEVRADITRLENEQS
jgi:hypothetical protein